MDFNLLLQNVLKNINPFTVTLAVLLVGSEVMGSRDDVKASSWYLIVKATLATIRDQVWPTKAALPAPTPAPENPTNPTV